MYCIVNVVYGTHITQKAYNVLEKLGLKAEDLGFITLYSGGSNVEPSYLGVSMSEFDEATDIGIRLSSLQTQPTTQDKKEAKKLFDKLPEKLRNILPPLDVYLVFSTS